MRLNTTDVDGRLQAGQELLSECSSFSYLGCLFETDADCNVEFEARLKKAYARLAELTFVWRKNKLTPKLKRRLIQSLVFPLLTYGCEAWNLSRDSLDKLASFELNAYRRALRVSYTTHTRNTEILTRVGLQSPTLVTSYQLRKLGYFGHVIRHGGMDRTVMDGWVPGKRRQGGQKKQWSDDIKSWLGLSFTEACHLAQDRQAFRVSIHKASRRTEV